MSAKVCRYFIPGSVCGHIRVCTNCSRPCQEHVACNNYQYDRTWRGLELCKCGFAWLKHEAGSGTSTPIISVGDHVQIVTESTHYHDHLGKVGRILRVDNSDRPYYVKFSAGDNVWFAGDDVAKVHRVVQLFLDAADADISITCASMAGETLGALTMEPSTTNIVLRKMVVELATATFGDPADGIFTILTPQGSSLGDAPEHATLKEIFHLQ